MVDNVLRKKQVIAATGLARTTIDEAIIAGTFPKPIHLGPRAVGWLASEIEAWQQKRIEARDAGREDRSGLAGTAKAHHDRMRGER